jgi:hypothetical protein
MTILSSDPAVIRVAEALHRLQQGCRRDIDGFSNCEGWTPDPHEKWAKEYVQSGASYLIKCVAHGEYEPCPTCQSYIAGGL